MSSKQLTILVTGTNGIGHHYANAGIGLPLLRRGHRVVFLIDENFRGKLSAFGFEEHVYEYPKRDCQTNAGPTKLASDLLKSNVFAPVPPEEKMKNVVGYLTSESRFRDLALQDKELQKAVDLYKPDLIVYDAIEVIPSLHYGQIPWIRNSSSSPSYYLFGEKVVFPPVDLVRTT